MSVSVVIPVFNQLAYTKGCLESLRAAGGIPLEVVVVDNGSSDGTGRNGENRGCAAAWNQGVAASRAEWIVLLNNDVIVSRGWVEGMLEFAEEHGIDIVSPAIREGEINYDIEEYGGRFVRRMGDASRMGVADGICFMVRRRVFERIGMFDEAFRIGQFEDVDFFRRAVRSGFRLGTGAEPGLLPEEVEAHLGEAVPPATAGEVAGAGVADEGTGPSGAHAEGTMDRGEAAPFLTREQPSGADPRS